jgi:hypothetical protein
MIGFVLMIKYYDKKPKLDEVKKMIAKEKTRHPDDFKYEVEIDLEAEQGGRRIPMLVPKGVAIDLEIRRKFPLFLILFGLFLQIMPIVL